MTALEKTQTVDASEGAGGSPPAYLLAVHGETSLVFRLPRSGVVLVGRGADADLQVDVSSMSRRHAKFLIADAQVAVADMESHNGTRVNGERISGARTLASGDVVTMGDVAFVLRCEAGADKRQVLDLDGVRQRLSAELERAKDYGRTLSVLAISLGDGAGDRVAAGAKAVEALRLMDVIGWAGASQLIVIVPELAGEAARSVGAQILDALSPLCAGVKGGVACYPTDGCDTDTLISAARNAADVGAPGTIGLAAAAAVHHTIGDKTIVLADPAMIHLFSLIRRLAARDMPILILGETGAGKESAASAIHAWSPRAAGPFVSINCATLQENLAESELFGHEKGAFTEAKTAKPGLLEAARGGTVFFDEVGELPDKVQAKLLRVLETQRIMRVGDVREREIDVRVVAATNRDLVDESRAGRFRQDLFFRLNAGCVHLPPLRDRPREILILARRFLAEERARFGQPPVELSEATLQVLASHDWPGNVRELRNAIAWAATMVSEGTVEPWDLPAGVRSERPEPLDAGAGAASAGAQAPASRPRSLPEELRRLERTRIQEALDASDGVQVRAAVLLGMPLRTFVYKVKQHGLAPKGGRRRN